MMGRGIKGRIRRAGIGDADDIAHVINESNYHAYKDVIPKGFFKHPVVSRDEVLEDMRRMEFYVYEVRGEIVGVAALHPRYSEGVGVVRWVYVHPRYQRRGIGTALMRRIEERARELGLRRLRLVTHGEAYWAIRFYEKLGFKIVGYVERAAWGDVLMEKSI